MRQLLVTIAILAMSFKLIGASVSAQQDDFTKNIRKNMGRQRKEKSLPSDEENKLEAGLLNFLLLAEQADTSKEKMAELTEGIHRDEHLHSDSLNRIRIIIRVRSQSEMAHVVAFVHSAGGEVERVGKRPYLVSRVYPRALRLLIASKAILRIEEQVPGSVQ